MGWRSDDVTEGYINLYTQALRAALQETLLLSFKGQEKALRVQCSVGQMAGLSAGSFTGAVAIVSHVRLGHFVHCNYSLARSRPYRPLALTPPKPVMDPVLFRHLPLNERLSLEMFAGSQLQLLSVIFLPGGRMRNSLRVAVGLWTPGGEWDGGNPKGDECLTESAGGRGILPFCSEALRYHDEWPDRRLLAAVGSPSMYGTLPPILWDF